MQQRSDHTGDQGTLLLSDANTDPGANTHLVDGNIAEREGLQMISDKTSAIRVVGGSEIKTEHGVY